jgi:replicative DNA helicase
VSAAAERALLGALLIDPDALGRVRGLVAAEDFAGARGRAVYGAMCALHDRGEPCDYVLLEAELERRGELGKVVPAADVIGLCLHTPTSLHAEAYARVVREAAALRRARERPPDRHPAAI